MQNLTARRRLAMRFVLVTAAVVAVACGGESATGVQAATTPVGEYSLSTVNGKGLPYRVYSDTGYSVDITTSTLSLRSDGSYVATSRIDERVDNHLSVYSDSGKGTWSQNGTQLTFTGTDNSKQGALFAGGNITMVDSSGTAPLTYLYARK